MRQTRRWALALALGFTNVSVAGLAQSTAGPVTGYQGPIMNTASVARERSPLWTMKTDRADYGVPDVLAAGNRLVARVGGRLEARELATGRRVWTADGRLLALTESSVFVSSGKTLLRRLAGTGAVSWRRTLPGEAGRATVSGGTLYVTTTKGGLAIDGGTGRVRWQFSAPEMQSFVGTASGGTGQAVTLWSAYQGEPHFSALYGFDDATGRQLYRLGGTSGPLTVRAQGKGAEMLLADAGFMGDEGSAELRWADLHTGKTTRTLRLRADFTCPSTQLVQRSTRETFWAGNFVYLADRCRARLSQFAVPSEGGADTPLSPQRVFAAPGDARYVLGPVGHVVVLEDRTGALRLVPISGGAPMNFNGVDMPTGMGVEVPGRGAVSRLDAHGDVLYVGWISGQLLAYDVKARRSLYSVRLPWPGFGPTLRAGAYTVLTTPGQVAVIGEGP